MKAFAGMAGVSNPPLAASGPGPGAVRAWAAGAAAAMDSATAQTGGSALISRETRGLRGNIMISPVVCDLFPDG
jgi:hypothetical protein